ncbi:flagellar biosynthesis anti-sigma factor FlgM [Dyella sp. A6]|uniref:flagellar biosynthesis anti-sigma factor FlgM n=1 Tax=Dyella aluminiiresistens TaxID=3069105 RepID=UPI002E78D39C|nr:flagellar biosynthesis anti-sigma factor FlgM [Dyella sp. A6]
MNTTITSNGLPLPPQTKSSQGSGTQQGASTSTESTSATAGAGSDSLKLTASAQSLQDVAKAGSGQQVNTQRVEQIRQSLANGTYQINPGHIADRLISIEGQLSSKS